MAKEWGDWLGDFVQTGLSYELDMHYAEGAVEAGLAVPQGNQFYGPAFPQTPEPVGFLPSLQQLGNGQASGQQVLNVALVIGGLLLLVGMVR